MIPSVHTLEDAMDWFLENSVGQVLVTKPGGRERVCSSYAEAKAFYDEP